jgi:type IV pilus assembly protein PilA
MNYTNFKIQNKFLQSLLFNKDSKGFTLIELLVVMIIIGVLVAISLPNFINQIGKARETEAKNMLGSIARSQQAYHFEKQTFASTMRLLELSGTFRSKYYNILDPSIANDVLVKHQATAINHTKDRVRDYAIGVYYDAGLFEIVFCQGQDVGVAVEAPDTSSDSDPCTNGGSKIE